MYALVKSGIAYCINEGTRLSFHLASPYYMFQAIREKDLEITIVEDWKS